MNFSAAPWALSLCALYLFSATAGAQEEQDKLSLRMASVTRPPQEQYYLLTAKDAPVKVNVSTWQLSKAVTVTRGKKYYLTTKVPDAEQGENPAMHAICSFAPSVSGKEIIGILFRQQKDSAGHEWKMHQIEGDKANFKAGQRKVFNLSRYPIQIKFAGKVVKIAPRKSDSLKIPNSLKGEFIPVHGVFSTDASGKKWRRFLSSRWTANKHTRSIIFVYPQRSTKSLSYHGLDDSLE